MKKKKAFTLIELIAVLVILAILALIVTPLVMNIIKKARISADKRSIDAYGRSIELAIASYLLDEGKFPSSINELTIEYSGDEVVCSTTQLNGDSSVYLAGCTVGGRIVNYEYGINKNTSYQTFYTGDHISYKGVNYYVLEDSNGESNVVKLLKEDPLTVEEVELYGGVGTDNNHVNKYAYPVELSNQVIDVDGYGSAEYYSSDTCKSYFNGSTSVIETGCITNYSDSDIKYIIDNWANDNFGSIDLKLARLITIEEYKEHCTEEQYQSSPSNTSTKCVPQYSWLNINYAYYTMTPHEDYDHEIYVISRMESYSWSYIYIHPAVAGSNDILIRPVVELYKTAPIVKLAT